MASPARLFPQARNIPPSGITEPELRSCVCESEARVSESTKETRFHQLAMPHMDAAYNLARWLTGNQHDAEDVTQEAFLRAFRFFDGFRGEDARTWLLRIVRNTYYTQWRQARSSSGSTVFDEDIHSFKEDESLPAFGRPGAADPVSI